MGVGVTKPPPVTFWPKPKDASTLTVNMMDLL